MPEPRSDFADSIDAALSNASTPMGVAEEPIRQLLRTDPMERMVTGKLLIEAVGKALELHALPEGAGMLLVDCLGGSEGARAASALIPLIQDRLRGTCLVHLSCATKGRGVSRLIERMLRALVPGLNAQIDALSTPATAEEVAARLADLQPGPDMSVVFAPLGSAGLFWQDRGPAIAELIRTAHASVLTYLDPESLVASLPDYERVLTRGNGFDRLRIELHVDGESGMSLLGSAMLGPGGDAPQRLWVLLDNARRHRYEARLLPCKGDVPRGTGLICPCRTLIERHIRRLGAGVRLIPCGSLLAVVAEGRETLS